MDPNVKPDQLTPQQTVHQGGRVESAPIIAPVESSHPMPEVSGQVVEAGVTVVDTAPKLSHTMFNPNPDPKVEIPGEQTPAWLIQQIKAEEKALKNDPKQSVNWLRRLHIAVMEKLGVRQLEAKPTGV